MKYYAGIGSRKTPPDILLVMSKLAVALEKRGYTLRSGGVEGADKTFESKVLNKEIYLPWRLFNGNSSPLHIVTLKAIELGAKHHEGVGLLIRTR